MTGLHSSRHAPLMGCPVGWNHASPSVLPRQSWLRFSSSRMIWVCAGLPLLLMQPAVAIEGCLASGACTSHALSWVPPVHAAPVVWCAGAAKGTPRLMATYALDTMWLRNCSCMVGTTWGSLANSITPVVSMSSRCSTCTHQGLSGVRR